MAPTSGFTLSALPRPLSVPARIGEIDTREIYDAVRAGLQTTEAMQGAPTRNILATDQAKTTLEQNPLRTQILAEQATQAPIHTALLSGEVQQLPARNRLLTAQATGAEDTVAGHRATVAREAALRERAAMEMPEVSRKIAEANTLTDDNGDHDYHAQAAALRQIGIDHPWVFSGLPETKGIATSLEKNSDLAQQAASKVELAREANTSREKVATERVTALVKAAELRAGRPVGQQAGLIRELVDLGYDDSTIDSMIERLNAPKDRTSVEVGNNRALERASNELRQSQKDLADAVATGDEEAVAAATEAVARADAHYKLTKEGVDKFNLHHEQAKSKVNDMSAAIGQIASKFGGKGAATPTPVVKTATAPGAPAPKQLTPDVAQKYLQAAGGDKDKARELARKDGWSF